MSFLIGECWWRLSSWLSTLPGFCFFSLSGLSTLAQSVVLELQAATRWNPALSLTLVFFIIATLPPTPTCKHNPSASPPPHCHQLFPAIARQQRAHDANGLPLLPTRSLFVFPRMLVRARRFFACWLRARPVFIYRDVRTPFLFLQTVNRLSSHSESHWRKRDQSMINVFFFSLSLFSRLRPTPPHPVPHPAQPSAFRGPGWPADGGRDRFGSIRQQVQPGPQLLSRRAAGQSHAQHLLSVCQVNVFTFSSRREGWARLVTPAACTYADLGISSE